MPARIMKDLPIMTRAIIIRNSLSLLKGKLPRLQFNHIKRLIRDGTERDLVFMQGLTTGLQLAVLDKENLQTLLGIMKIGIKREEDGRDAGSLFEKSELEKVDVLLRGKFNLNARKRILNTLARSDSILLNGLIILLKKVYSL